MKLLINTAVSKASRYTCEVILLNNFSEKEMQNPITITGITNARTITEELPQAVKNALNSAKITVADISEIATNINGAPSMRLRICSAFVQGLARALNINAVGYAVDVEDEQSAQLDFSKTHNPFPQYDRDAGVVANVPEPIVKLTRKTADSTQTEVFTVQKLSELTEKALNQLYALEEQLFARDKWSKESLEAAFHSGIYTFIVILDHQQNIIASSYLAKRDENIFDIDSVGVSNEYQGVGAGKLLMHSVMKHIESDFSQNNVVTAEQIVNLEVRVSNERAISLYHKFGFKEVRRVKAYYKNPLEDALFMMRKGGHKDNKEAGSVDAKIDQITKSNIAKPRQKQSITLGIESSCDETGVAIVQQHHILAQNLATSLNEHIEFGGVIPETAAREHIVAIDLLVKKTLDEAGLNFSDVDNICVTGAPGLIGCLSVGSAYAKGLALGANKPLFAVNHLTGHLLAAELAVQHSLPEQFLGLIVSGGHSDLLLREQNTVFKHLGGTIDDAAGEAFDKIGRVLGINYPAGKEIDLIAKKGNPNVVKFPRPLTGAKYDQSHRYDFSFSGLKTAAIRALEEQKALPQAERLSLEDFCASFQEAVVDVLVTKTLRAAADYQQTSIVLGGGFSANSRLRSRMQDVCSERGITLIIPEIKYCTDNGAMIANLGSIVQDLLPSNESFSPQSVVPLETVVL